MSVYARCARVRTDMAAKAPETPVVHLDTQDFKDAGKPTSLVDAGASTAPATAEQVTTSVQDTTRVLGAPGNVQVTTRVLGASGNIKSTVAAGTSVLTQDMVARDYETIKMILSQYTPFPDKGVPVRIYVRNKIFSATIQQNEECYGGNCHECFMWSDDLDSLFDDAGPTEDEVNDIQIQLQKALMPYCVNASTLKLKTSNKSFEIEFSLRIDPHFGQTTDVRLNDEKDEKDSNDAVSLKLASGSKRKCESVVTEQHNQQNIPPCGKRTKIS